MVTSSVQDAEEDVSTVSELSTSADITSTARASDPGFVVLTVNRDNERTTVGTLMSSV